MIELAVRASKSVQSSWPGRGLSLGVLVWVLCAFPLLCQGEEELGEIQFSLNTVHAALGENPQPVTFSIENFPADRRLKSFAFTLSFDPVQLSFQQANVLLPGKNPYYTDEVQNGDTAQVHVQVTCLDPVSLESTKAVALSFWPSPGEHQTEPDDAPPEITFPIHLVPGSETWIEVVDTPPLLPVGNLNDGGIELDLRNGIRLGAVTGQRGRTVRVPVLVTAVSEIRYLNVGIDYVEDMLELLSVIPTDTLDTGFAVLTAEKTAGRVDLALAANNGAFLWPASRVPILELEFGIKLEAAAGTTLTVGNAGTVVVNHDPAQRTAFYSPGAITVEENDGKHFRRGDANVDGRVDASDAVITLGHLFGREPLPCRDAADINDDGEVDMGDVVGMLTYVFQGGTPPPAPFPDAGLDPTFDDLGPCEDRR